MIENTKKYCGVGYKSPDGSYIKLLINIDGVQRTMFMRKSSFEKQPGSNTADYVISEGKKQMDF